ncbi:unnamed protein product, partial [Tilletia caries]
MSAQDQTTPGSAGADSVSQRQPTLADIFNAITDIRDRVATVEKDLAAQRQDLATHRAALANLVAGSTPQYLDNALRTPPNQTAGGMASQGATRVPDHEPTVGFNLAAPPVL